MKSKDADTCNQGHSAADSEPLDADQHRDSTPSELLLPAVLTQCSWPQVKRMASCPVAINSDSVNTY